MPIPALELVWLSGRFSVCRLPPRAPLPKPPAEGGLYSVTRTADELSIVCPEDSTPEGAAVETGWRALRVAGTLDFGEIGVLASLAEPLAAAGVSIFAVSTYDTDHLLVRDADVSATTAALEAVGHRFAGASV